MARYVMYTPDVYAILDGPSLHVWYFPQEFSQSRLGDRVTGSNACTIIAILLSCRIHEFSIQIWGYIDQALSRMLVTSIAEAIIEGNEIHETLGISGQLNNINLTVPEAIQAVQFKYPLLTEWIDRTIIVTRPIGQTLFQNIQPSLYAWINHPPVNKIENSSLFIVLVADSRSVLFVFQPSLGKVTLIDPHSHNLLGSGLIVAQSKVADLKDLCEWYVVMCSQAFGMGTDLSLYELSCLYLANPLYSS